MRNATSEGVEKETSKHNLNSFERPISPRWSDNKDNLRRSTWESASRTQDGNMIGLTDGWCTMPSRAGRDGDVGGQTDGWGSPFGMTEGNGDMNRQNDGLGLALTVRNGNSYMDRQTDGWGTALNETDLDSRFERYAEGWDTTVTKIDRVGNMNKHADGWGTAFKKTDGLGTDLSKSDGWGASISPGCDTWRRDSPAASPNGGWSRSHRLIHRTRSRSPDRGLKHGSDGWDRRDRSSRIGAGDSALLCRHYASGICRRGSQVRFLHDDRGQVDPDASPSDFRVSGFKKGRYSRHDDREKFADSWKQRDHLEDRFSCRDVDLFDADYEKHEQRHGSHYYDVLEKQGRSHGHQYDGDYKKHVQRHGSFHDGDCARLSLRHRGHYSDKHGSDERHRMGSRHSIHCYAFTKGRCQRSLASRFVHDASYDGGCLMNDDAKEKIHDRRVAHTSFRQRPERHRTSDCSCNYSAEGHCCHGDCNLCCQSMPNRHSEGKPYDDRWSDNLDTNKSSSWNGPNWGSHDIDNGSSWNGRKWGDRMTTMDASVSSLFRDDKHDTRHIDSVDREGSILKPQFTQSPQEAAQTDLPLQEMNNMLTTNSILGQSLGQGQHVENLEPQPLQELSCSVSMQNQQITPRLSSTHQVEVASNAEDSNFTRENQQRHPLTPIWQQQQNVNPGNQNMESLPELLHVNGHSQEITHLPTPSGSVAPQSSINAPKHNSNEQNHQAHFQHFSNTQNTGEESRSESEKTVLGRSQVIFDTFFTELVPGAQVTQIRNIPASLLYGNGQQLPQHHTRFNPTNAPRFAPSRSLFDHHSETPSAPVMSDSCDLPHELSLKSVERKDQTKEELNTNLKSLAPLSVSVESDGGKPNKDSGLEDQQRQENHGSTLVQLSGLLKSKEVKETETGPKSRAPQSHQLEDLDTAVHTDGVVKISKDDKGLKMFKFALVEFVKDLLKPTWKEGSLSKEAYKIIVKKVAEKVTGTLHGPNIPNTKERIDIYLSFAKSKIEKLVQAYAERYVKTPPLLRTA